MSDDTSLIDLAKAPRFTSSPEATQTDEGEPPPQELNWGSTLAEFFGSSLWFSDELIDPAKPPRFIRMYADRWQINWMESGIGDPAAQSIVDVYITVRPVAPATITIKV